TRAPFAMPKSEEAFPRAFPKVFDTSIGWRFENPKMAQRFPLHSMGETAENVADKWKISREEQDQFALASHKKAAAATETDAFKNEMAPVSIPQKKGDPIVFAKDESPRPDTTIEALAKLSPVFRKNGSVTAGNSSPINDGASAMMLMSEDAMKSAKLEP